MKEFAHRVSMNRRNMNVVVIDKNGRRDTGTECNQEKKVGKHIKNNNKAENMTSKTDTIGNINKIDLKYICEPDGETYESDTTGTIVTMTSWSKRIGFVYNAVKCILSNTVLPEKIIINLSTEEFPEKENSLPENLVKLVNENDTVVIHWLKHNTTVWKKIIPTLCRFKKAKVICIDDDIEYPNYFIKNFESAYEKSDKNHPLSGAKISFYNGLNQHCGHGSLDKYEFYEGALEQINDKIIKLKSSDSVYTVMAHKCGHDIKHAGFSCMLYKKVKGEHETSYSRLNKISGLFGLSKNADNLIQQVKPKKEEKQVNNNKILVCVTTYKRNEFCKKLVEQILDYGKKYEIEIAVWDDNTENRFSYKNDKVKVFYNKTNRGKFEFWKTWQDMFDYCKSNKHEYYLFLQDDNILCENFFEKIFTSWKSIRKPISLSPLLDDCAFKKWESRWGKKKYSVENESAIKSNWVECVMLVKNDFFESLNWKVNEVNKSRWNTNKSLSSGVGLQFTTRLQELGKNMYHSMPSLIKLEQIKSTMNIEEREKNPLLTDITSSINCQPIVSFTTYQKRFCNIKKVIQSIKKQTFKPNKIVLTLFKNDYDRLGEDIKKYIESNNVEIIISDLDLKPHKKYYYVMQKYRSNPIITIDDDVEYNENLVSKLMESYYKHPLSVSCCRGRKLEFKNGNIVEYMKCKVGNVEYDKDLYNFLPTGIGGVLYPPNILNISKDNLDEIQKYLDVDDIYLKIIELRKKIPNVYVDFGKERFGTDIKNKDTTSTALFSSNMKNNDNFIKQSNLEKLILECI